MPVIQTSFFYDPYRQGYDTNEWRTLLGTPYLDANRIEITTGAISHYADILKGDITFNLQAPADPTGMDTIIGLYQPSRGAFIVFSFADTLNASVSDGTNTTTSSDITWDSSWTGQKVDFRIVWESGIVKFFIAGTRVATITGDYVPSGPLALYAFDASVNPMSIGAIDVRGSQYVFVHQRTSETTTPAQPVGNMLAVQSVTTTDVPTVLIPILVPNVSDAVAVAESSGAPTVVAMPNINDAITIAEDIGTFAVSVSPEVNDTATVAEDVGTPAVEVSIGVDDTATVVEDVVENVV